MIVSGHTKSTENAENREARKSAQDHYTKLATNTLDNPGLAYLVLANACWCEWAYEPGGPSEEILRLAESIVGVSRDFTVGSFMTVHSIAYKTALVSH